MADVQSNIHVNIDTSEALASIKLLQKQISAFHTSMAKSGAAASAVSANMQQNLINSLNASGKWSASMRTVKTTTESFTNALEKNKLSMRDYYRYSMGATKTFGRLFSSEFDTISKVARERVKDLQTQYIKLGRDANGAMKAIAIRPLALDMQNYGTQTAIASQRQALLNQLMKQGATNMLNFGKNTQWAGRQLMVGFTIPLTYLGTAAAKTFMQLEEQAIRFKRVYGEMFTTGAETEKMLSDIQILAKQFTKYGVAVEKTMEMAATAAAQGKMGAELLAQVNEATRLSVLGGVEQEQSLETTISLTNAFGLSAEKLAQKINFLNAVENQTVVSIEDLTVAIPKAGPVVKQLGGDVEDLAFFLTAMKEGGINASEGANALKSGLASLINPTDKASQMLADMGINLKGIVETNKGNVKQVVLDFAAALNTLDPLNRAKAIEQLFGKFQFARLSTLFQNVIQQGNQASRVLKLTQATTEELAILSERELSKVEESTTYKFKKTIEDLKVSLAPVGEQFLKAITPIAEFIGKVLEKFNNLGDGTKKFVVILTTLLGGIGPILLMTFGLLANGLANIIKLFVSMKSIFNRAGQSSNTLGEQTQYLTSEQAEAASVAASLNQIHTRLQQTFTSETSALNALISAYQRAIAAQRGFSGPIIGGGKRAKFASGTTKVRPFYFARGTDTVPAMLTPGEAVIPAGPAQDPRNKPAIKHMIAGGTMEYLSEGVGSVVEKKLRRIGSGSEGRVGKSGTTVPIPYKLNVSNSGGAVPFTSINPASMVNLSSIYAKDIAKAAKISVTSINKEIKEWQIANKKAIDVATEAVQKGIPAEKAFGSLMEKFNADMKRAGGPVSKFADAARKMAPMLQQDLIQAQNEARRLGLNVKNAADATALAGKLPNNIVAQSITKPGNFQGLSKARGAGISMFGGAAGLPQYGIPRFMLTPGIAPASPAYLAGTSQEHFGQTKQEQAARAANREQRIKLRVGTNLGKQTAQHLVNGLEQGLRAELQSASPSKRMQKIGQDAGRGLIIGAQEYVDDARVAGQQIGVAATQGVMSQAQMAAASRASLYGGGPIDASQKSLRRQLQKQARIAELAQKKPLSQSTIMPMVAGAGTAKPTVAGKFSNWRQNKIEQQRLAKAERGSRPGVSMGGVGMGLSMAAMAGSMVPGKVGDVSQKLMMPLMMLTMIGPMLQTPIGALMVSIGAMAAGIIKLRMEFDKAQDSSIKLRESLSASKDSMRNLAKFSGNVTAGEIMDRRRDQKFGLVGAKPGKTTFGEAYVSSKEGKTVMDATVESLKTRGVKATGGDLTNQLVSSVLAGALSAEQAKSIALNIGQKTGNYGLGFSVTAQINQLIGPNGENLEKDPLEIRMKLIEQTEGQNKQLFQQMQEKGGRGGFLNMGALNPNVAMGGMTAAGAGLGAAIGTAILPGIGTIVGTGLGAIAGAVGGYFSQRGANERNGKLSGAVVASQRAQMEQQKEMLDSLDLYYQKKIKELEIEGKITEAKALQQKYDEDRNKLVEKGAQLNKDIMTNYGATKGNVRSAMDTGIDKLLTQRYKNSDEIQYLDAAKTLLSESQLTKEQQYLIKVKMSTGELTPSQQMFLFSNFGNDKNVQQQYMDIITRFSATTADDATRVMGMFSNPDGTPNKELQTKFLASVATKKDDKEASKYIDFFAEVANTNGVFDMTAILNFYMKNPEMQAKTQEIIDNIDKNKGKLTLDVMTNFLPENVMGSIDKAYFEKLSQDERVTYLKEIATIVNVPDPVIQADPEFIKWQKEGALYNGVSYSGKSIGEQIAAYRQFQPWKVTQESIAQASAAPAKTTSNGGKVDSSPLDDIVKKLRDVRKNQIKVTEGWSASMKTLDQLFGGKKRLEMFSGIEQDLAKLGAKGNFIELIVGMDPKEYEKRKNQLFKFDNNNNIIGLKKDAKTIQEALNAVVAGDYASQMIQLKQEIADQSAAYDILTKAGLSYADTQELIADKAFAAMIASEGNTKAAQKLIKLLKEAKTLSKGNQIKTDLQGDINTDKEAAAARANLAKAAKANNWSWLEADAILSDDTLREAMANWDKLTKEQAAVFQERLQQVLNSIEFKQSIFDKGFEKAMEKFSVMETKIELDFQFTTLKDQDIIEKAQDKIAGINYQIDDWEASLKGIEEQEQKINDKYDLKYKALDEIRSLNDKISKQQKGQLTLADALSQGDIAAAARAAQDIRSQQATDAIDNQQKLLDAAKENELANVRNEKGYTRAQIEDQIKNLRDQIFKIEEQELEPAQERVRIEEAKKRELIQSLTVLGKTKLEWEAIKNRIDLARTSSAEYMQAIAAALGVVDDIIKYWNSLDGKIITTTHKIVTIYEGGGTPGPGGPGPGPGPGPEPCPPGHIMNDAGNCVPVGGVSECGPGMVKADDGRCVPAGSFNTDDGDGKSKTDGSKNGNDSTGDSNTDYSGRLINGFTPYLIEAKQEYDKIVAKSLAPGATPSDFGHDLASADQKVINALNLVDAKNEYNKKVTQSLTKGATPSDFGAGLAASDMKVVNLANKVIASSTSANAAKAAADAAAKAKAAADIKKFGGNAIAASQFANWPSGKSSGGLIKRFAVGGPVIGTDVVPSMLTPGEFIMSKYAVNTYGVDKMRAINNGDVSDASVYNYSIAVNVKSDANPDEIARAVMGQIRQVDSKRLRSRAV
jgi:TP901 family phage tail tape measure protein